MLAVWKSMWSNDEREPEPMTPWVIAALAIASIALGNYLNFGGTLF